MHWKQTESYASQHSRCTSSFAQVTVKIDPFLPLILSRSHINHVHGEKQRPDLKIAYFSALKTVIDTHSYYFIHWQSFDFVCKFHSKLSFHTKNPFSRPNRCSYNKTDYRFGIYSKNCYNNMPQISSRANLANMTVGAPKTRQPEGDSAHALFLRKDCFHTVILSHYMSLSHL